jgi:hypothetical protein
VQVLQLTIQFNQAAYLLHDLVVNHTSSTNNRPVIAVQLNPVLHQCSWSLYACAAMGLGLGAGMFSHGRPNGIWWLWWLDLDCH